MSYANLINQASASNVESFKRIRDFICRRNGSYDYSATGIGWTLWDSSYATDENNPTPGDWIVINSAGEGGAHTLYFKITLNTFDMTVYGYLYWDTGAKAGVQQFGASGALDIPAGATTLWVYGDLDHVKIGYVISTTNYLFMFGSVREGEGFYNNTVVTSSAAISPGSNVVVTLDSAPAGWYVGQKLYHWDSAGVQIVTIAATGTSSVTLTTVSTAKAVGSKLTGDLGYFCQSAAAMATFSMAAGRDSTAMDTATAQTINWATTVAGKDVLNNKVPAADLYIVLSGAAYGKLPGIKGTSTVVAEHNAPFVDPAGASWRFLLGASAKAFLVEEAA